VSDVIDVYEAMRTARAVRRYRPDPVPDDVLARCLKAATWAPSGSNRQAWRFVVLRSAEARAILGPAYRQGWADMAPGYGGPGPDDGSPRARMLRTMRHFVDHFEDVPVYVLFCVQTRGREVHLTDGASVYPALQNFLLACRAEGLGAVTTTWYLYAEKELRELVGVPDDWLLAALVPVGWPVGRHGPVRRRPLAELASADRWDAPYPGVT
jgi:nitroreductase